MASPQIEELTERAQRAIKQAAVPADSELVARKPQQLDKRVRLSRCISKLRLPTNSGRAELVVQCQLEKHDVHVAHEHRGVLHMGNDTLREFTISWFDGGIAQLYREAKVSRGKKTHDDTDASKRQQRDNP